MAEEARAEDNVPGAKAESCHYFSPFQSQPVMNIDGDIGTYLRLIRSFGFTRAKF